MNVIEAVRSILTDASIMDEFNGVHVDYTESGEAGIYTNGAVKISEDLIGNPTYRMNFQLYTGMQAFADYDRLKNSDFLLRLTYYLDTITGVEITETVNEKECPGEITKISCSNAMLFDVPTGDINDGVRYQLQIAVTYKIYSED